MGYAVNHVLSDLVKMGAAPIAVITVMVKFVIFQIPAKIRAVLDIASLTLCLMLVPMVRAAKQIPRAHKEIVYQGSVM